LELSLDNLLNLVTLRYMKKLLYLVEVIESWNDGDVEAVKSNPDEPILDLHCVKARRVTIRKLKKLIEKLK